MIWRTRGSQRDPHDGQRMDQLAKTLEEVASAMVHIIKRQERFATGLERLVAAVAVTATERDFKNSGPEIMRRLGRIELALSHLTGDVTDMTKITDAALAKIEASITPLTSVVDAVKAYIEANVTAQAELAAQLEAEGVDVTRLDAFNDAIKANTDRLVALTVKGTPADTGTPVPAPVLTP